MEEVRKFLKALDPHSITFIGESSRKFEPLLYSELDRESISRVFLDQKSSTVVPASDLSIWINFEPRAKRDLNLDLLRNLAENSTYIIFGSRVPCYASKSTFFWPSYWCEVFEELGFDHSNLLKSMLWYDSLLTPIELEGLLFFKKKTSDVSEFGSVEIIDQLHPQHGCDHFSKGNAMLFFLFRLFPKKIYIGKELITLGRIKQLCYLGKPLATHAGGTSEIPVRSDRWIRSELDAYHPGHGCRHKDLYGKSPNSLKTYLLTHLTYSRRQKLKAVLPSWLISKAKRILLR